MDMKDILKDIILTGLRRDEHTPIIRFVPRSNRFTIDIKKDLSKSKIVGYRQIYSRLKRDGVIIENRNDEGHRIYQLNTNKIDNILYDFQKGSVYRISVVFKPNGSKVGGFSIEL